jgi:polar amino acid transport system substrate-binding protein
MVTVIGFVSAVVSAAYAQHIVISTLNAHDPATEIAEKIMTEAYKRIGLTMDIRYFPGERALETANSGDVDGELYRKNGIEQTFPNLIRIPFVISKNDFVVFTKSKSFKVKGWESLAPYSVGYQRGVKAIEMNLTKDTKAEAVTTLEQAFKKLDQGRSDVVIDARLSGLRLLKDMRLNGIGIVEPPLAQIENFHYLHVKNKHLVEPLTMSLQQMEKEGVLQKLQQQVVEAIQSPLVISRVEACPDRCVSVPPERESTIILGNTNMRPPLPARGLTRDIHTRE